MLHLRIASPPDLTAPLIELLTTDPAVSAVASFPGASVQPIGDVVHANVAREAANDVIDRIHDLGVTTLGSLQVDNVRSWISGAGLDAQRRAPGSSADSVVWAEVTQQAYDDSEPNWTFLALISLATLLASVAIILDSQILVIGAMIIGPEFGASLRWVSLSSVIVTAFSAKPCERYSWDSAWPLP